MLRWLIPIAPLVLVLQPCRGFAADVVFSGSLERVGHESISVRLPDHRVIDARLPNTRLLAAGKIAAQYNMGDQVEITCRAIKPVWDEDASRFQSLELTKLRFLRLPSPEELSTVLASRPWRAEVNLLSRPNAAVSAPKMGLPDAPSAKADALDTVAHRKLEQAREVNLEYASNMPNFVADETAKRYTSDGSSQWRYLDTIETEITFNGSRAVRQQIRRNGKAWGRPFQALPGFKWYGGFGTEIGPLFDLQCPTTIDYVGGAEVRGKPLLEYRFSSPPDGCFGPFFVKYQRYNPARNGHVFIDDVIGMGGNIIQLDEEATGFPAEFEFAERKEEVSWGYVKIGDASHLLPVGANFVVLYSSGKRWRIEVVYKNHRHFETSTDIKFH
jgi:hypothetical protein